jgi:hypothetical protein
MQAGGLLRGAAIFCLETSFQFTFRTAYLSKLSAVELMRQQGMMEPIP